MSADRKLTELTRGRFNDLLSGIEDNSLLEKWVDGFEPENKADLVESRQIRALGCWIDSGKSLKDLQELKWSRMEFWADGEHISLRLMA